MPASDRQPSDLSKLISDDPAPEAVDSVRRDLTAQLDRQARVFETTLSSITDFAYIFDRDGRFRYANTALLDLWGLSLNDAVGKNFFDLKYPDELAAKLQRQIQQVIATGERLLDETPYTSPTGASGYYEYIFSPVFAANGSVEVVAGSTRDITDRKRTERLLEVQKQSLELVASGKPLGEILAFLTGIIESQSPGDSVASVLLLDDDGVLRVGAAPSLPDDFNRAIDGIKAREDLGTCSVAAITGKVVITTEIAADPKWQCIKHLPAGEGLKAAWSRPIVASDGRVLGTIGTYFRECRSPTLHEQQLVEILSHTAALAIERLRADQERERLLASERAARADADAASLAKDRFLAVLSHELRTPLSPVAMTIPAIELDPELPFKFREDLAMIRRNIDLEVKLIDDLLDLSRVTSGKLRLQMQRVHVHEVLRHAIRNSAGEISAKRIVVSANLDGKNDQMLADPARLQQVFWNIIRNAVKFTPEGGRMRIRTWNSEMGNEIGVEVKDTGVGIPAEVLPRVFEAFEQGDPRTTRQFGGLGLGLAIAKAVVEMHRGTILAASDGENLGATFSIRLPVMLPAPDSRDETDHRAGDARQSARPARILLAEDHADTAQTLARLLRASGYHVTIADSVALALKLAQAERFDIVVSDIGLPDATGYDLMEQLRDRHRMKGIALSGYGMEEDVRRSRKAGFFEHVVKPVSAEQLKKVIERVIASATK